MDEGGATSELEGVLGDGSRFEVMRCNGRGGKECGLVGVVIFFKPSAEETPATMNAKSRRGAKGIRVSPIRC